MEISQMRANLLLLLAAAIWGLAFVAQRAGMEHIGPFAFNAIRFFLGALVLVPIIFWQRGREKIAHHYSGWKFAGGALLAGVLLFTGSTLQQIGIVYTTAGKAGFITGLYVVLVPILGLAWGQRVTLNTWVGVVLAAVGMYLLSIKGAFGLAKGDFLVFLSVFFWAGHVHVIGWLSPRANPFWLACVQFFTVSVFSWVGMILVETLTWSMVEAAAMPIFYAGCLSVGVAYTLQVVGQKTAKPAHAAIILSLEAAFALLGGWLVLHETLSLRALIGCALMLMGMMVSQLPKLSRKTHSA